MLHTRNPVESGAIAPPDTQAWFKQLFDLSPDPTWIIDGNRFVECNEAAVRILGYANRAELLNVHPSMLSPPTQPDGQSSYDKAESMMALAQANGLHRFEWMHTRADGSDILAEVTLSALQLADRKIIYCVWRDISERKQAESALRESQQRYSDLVENTPDLITSVDTKGRFVFVNKSAEIIFGLAPQECIGLSAFDFVYPEDRQATQKAFAEWVVSPEGTLSFENRQLGRDGAVHMMEWSIVAKHAATGEVCGFDSVARDITERRQAQEALRESEARLRNITFSMADWVWEVDDKCVYTYSSQKGFDYFGPGRESVIGKTPFDFMPPDEARRVAVIFAELAANKAPIKDLENWNIRSDGQRVCLLTNGVPLLDATGNLKGYRGVDKDITERKSAELKLQRYQNLMSAVLENFPGAVSIIDSDLQLTGYNNQFKQLLEFPDSLFEKPNVSFADFVSYNAQRGEYGPGNTEQHVAAIMERARKFQPHRFERVRPNGKVLEVRGEPLPNGGFVTVYLDITESKQLERQVRELAFYDPLTELPNRRLLRDRLSQTLAESKRSKLYGALMFLDLDNFKALNDKHGHEVGDLLLMQAAKRMKSCVREVDTVARLGGDEFVVVMGDLNESKAESSSQALSIAMKIRSALAEPYALTVQHEGKAEATVEHRCTASIGMVVFIDGEGSQDDFLRWADSAMYQAKEAGRNLIRFHEIDV